MTTASKISTLWVTVMFNMAFADILSFMFPGVLAQITTGTVDGVTITPAFLLVAALFLELAIAMIFVSRALPRRSARLANLVAVPVTILFVVGGGTLTPHYIFFGGLEVLTMLYIGFLALTWRQDVRP